MRSVVLHSAVPPDAPPDEQDVLVQACLIREALQRLGWNVISLPFAHDLEAVRRVLRDFDPDVVFNLVETVLGTGRLIYLAPALLDQEGLSYTGCGTEAVFCTSHKVLAKKWLSAFGLPTPPWWLPNRGTQTLPNDGLVIVKPIWEDASVGIDQEAVVSLEDPEAVRRAMARAERLFGSSGFFVERLIDGREFNLSLLAGPDGVQVLPAAEIRFVDFGPHRHRIVDYEAKWAQGSFAEQHTVRSFCFPEADAPLVDHLCALARQCWDLFGLEGYARIDFRVDAEGRPWILEINANPCLSPDAGFMAAALEAGLAVESVVQRLVNDALGTWNPFRQRQRCAQGAVGQKQEADASPGAAAKRCMELGHGVTLTFRNHVRVSDLEEIRRLTAQTGFFNEEEIFMARDLALQSLTSGPASGYFFILLEHAGHVVGYTCYGPIVGTAARFDLYWIVVDPAWQGRGVGRRLLEAAEEAIMNAGGQRVYVETSSRALYKSTRRFYLRAGYVLECTLPDFYGRGDHKIIYCKDLC
ncbi:GNAT family N-acetyltransferase [Desulfosoma sp.]|uniref:GNAT family N-acetyltransferase n=1 Tax=Desulfosoma sp. TaxID=2603217 RepID=UPI0040495AC2